MVFPHLLLCLFLDDCVEKCFLPASGGVGSAELCQQLKSGSVGLFLLGFAACLPLRVLCCSQANCAAVQLSVGSFTGCIHTHGTHRQAVISGICQRKDEAFSVRVCL